MRIKTRAASIVTGLVFAVAAFAEVELETPDTVVSQGDSFYGDIAPVLAAAKRAKSGADIRALMYERPSGEQFYNDETYARWFFRVDGAVCSAYQHINWTYYRRDEGELTDVSIGLLVHRKEGSILVAQSFSNNELRDEFLVELPEGGAAATVSRRTGGKVLYRDKKVPFPADSLAIWTSFYYRDSAEAIGSGGSVAVFSEYNERFDLMSASFKGDALSCKSDDPENPIDCVASFDGKKLKDVRWPLLLDRFYPVPVGDLMGFRVSLLPDVAPSSADIDTRHPEDLPALLRVRTIECELHFEAEGAMRGLSRILEPGLYDAIGDNSAFSYLYEPGTKKYRDPSDEELATALVSSESTIIVNDQTRELALEILDGETDPSRCAAALAKWVVNHVDYTLEVISQDSMATLENGKGDCSEFADLLACLLRSAGIPCMTVSGYFFDPNEIDFFHHAWVAVWTGSRWLEMEATAGMVASSPSYLPTPYGDWGADLEYIEIKRLK